MSNTWCADAPAFPLASGEALAGIERSPSQHIGVRAGDVEVCFCQYELPEDLKAFFCLPGLRFGALPAELRARLGDRPAEELVHFSAR
eukprot:6933569-Alexandrium_andersonii.AAC.1